MVIRKILNEIDCEQIKCFILTVSETLLEIQLMPESQRCHSFSISHEIPSSQGITFSSTNYLSAVFSSQQLPNNFFFECKEVTLWDVEHRRRILFNNQQVSDTFKLFKIWFGSASLVNRPHKRSLRGAFSIDLYFTFKMSLNLTVGIMRFGKGHASCPSSSAFSYLPPRK